MQRRSVTQEADAELRDQSEVGAPVAVVAALLHLVDAMPSLVDGGDAVLDARGEDEARFGHGPILHGRADEQVGRQRTSA
jgi:hypothetical protein